MGGVSRAIKKVTRGIFGSSQQATSAPVSLNVSTTGGGLSDGPGETATTEEEKRSPIQKKKMGTRGNRVPLASPKTAATTGVQI